MYLLELVRMNVQYFFLSTISSIVTFLVHDKGRSVLSIGGLPLAPRLVNAAASYLEYLRMMIWPADLAIFVSLPESWHRASDQPSLWRIATAVLFLTAISAFAVLRLRRQPWFAVGWLWYLGSLVPVIGIVQVGTQSMADRYSYVPLIGIFICLVWGTAELLAHRRVGQPVLVAMAVAAAITCVAITRQQLSHWRDSIVLFEHALAVTANNAVAHLNRCNALGRHGNPGAAIPHFRAALQADASYADAHYSMGLALTELGKLEEAAQEYRAVFRIRPGHAPARDSFGTLLWMLGKPDDALVQYAEAVRLQPDYYFAHFNMGRV